MKSDISKKWFKYSMFNVLVLFLIYGMLLVVLNVYAYTSSQNAGEEMLVNYANDLAGEKQADLNAHFDSMPNFSYYNENFSFAFYQRRADSSLEMKTTNDYLSHFQISLDKTQQSVKKEDVSGKKMLTFVTTLKENPDAYIKVFMPMGVIGAANSGFTVFIIIFAVVFCVVSLCASAAIGYLEIKPIAATYEKQKNFINDMSHEIRTPLAIIKGNLENAVLDKDAKVSDIMEMLEDSIQEVENISDMASGLLNIVRNSNVAAGGQKGNVCQVISEVVEVYSDLGAMQGKSLVASIDMVNMEVDKEKFKQLLVILLDNAIKYTNTSDRIKVKFKKTDKGNVLIVSDTGRGVPQEHLDKIFDRFYRAPNVSDLQGTGLGLSIAKVIVDNLKGRIYAKHNSPKGLTIVVEFNI